MFLTSEMFCFGACVHIPVQRSSLSQSSCLTLSLPVQAEMFKSNIFASKDKQIKTQPNLKKHCRIAIVYWMVSENTLKVTCCNGF